MSALSGAALFSMTGNDLTDVGKEMKDYMDANQVLGKKADNIIAKMKKTVAIAFKSGIDGYKPKLCYGGGNVTLVDGGEDMFKMPCLVGLKFLLLDLGQGNQLAHYRFSIACRLYAT